MAIQEIAQAFNPITGVFGTGQVQFFSASGTWSVPPGIGKVRARVWGGGGYDRGSGGGFSLRAIYDLTGVTSVAVTIGVGGSAATPTSGGTSSFGSYCSATGGATASGVVGAGTGGDINYSGGLGGTGGAGGGGGGVASLFGNGGYGGTNATNGGNGASGGGAGSTASLAGGNGFLGSGGVNGTAAQGRTMNTSGLSPIFSIDFIGTGGGGVSSMPGVNGGGGGSDASTGARGGFPGGGGGNASASGAAGLVIVEW